MSYYAQEECIPTFENYSLWLQSLNAPMQKQFSRDGFEKCKSVLNYKRFILELADIGMSQFMQQLLSNEDYDVWKMEDKNFKF